MGEDELIHIPTKIIGNIRFTITDVLTKSKGYVKLISINTNTKKLNIKRHMVSCYRHELERSSVRIRRNRHYRI